MLLFYILLKLSYEKSEFFVDVFPPVSLGS
jgi:hypothetical protein